MTKSIVEKPKSSSANVTAKAALRIKLLDMLKKGNFAVTPPSSKKDKVSPPTSRSKDKDKDDKDNEKEVKNNAGRK